MKNKYILYIAMTLDGFIADKDDNLEWLFKVEGKGDNGYQNFYNTIDSVVMGRRTYDWIIQNMDEYPYKDKDSYILTNREIKEDLETFNNIIDLDNKINDKKVWIVGGGQVISEYLNKGLVSEMRITVAPVILGEGISLFNNILKDVNLEFLDTSNYNQFVELHYKVK